jgi:plasmid maintenance system antidote protein VapI
MTLKVEDAVYEEHGEFLKFINNFGVKSKLVAELLDVKINTVHYYRMGYRKISKEKLAILKESYKSYILEKLKDL